MSEFTEEQVIALASDEIAALAVKALAEKQSWKNTGKTASTVWGEYKGSSSRPYLTRVNTEGPEFKCSCPSRKSPCKHGLALLLLLVRDSGAFLCTEPPGWAKEALPAKTGERKKIARTEAADSSSNSSKTAERHKERLSKIESGLSDLRLWMQDLMRQGLAAAEIRSYQYWDRMAARLTDAQAPGLARMLRQCGNLACSGHDWQAQLLARLAKIHLVTEGFRRIEELPEGLRHELSNVTGINVSQAGLLEKAGVQDYWQIMGQQIELEDRLKTQRTWLRGEQSGSWALILNFAHGLQPLDSSLVPGTKIRAELVFYPGNLPLRALIKSKTCSDEHIVFFHAYENADEFLQKYSEALSLNPWLDKHPIAINKVRAALSEKGKLTIVDRDGKIVPITADGDIQWQIMALSGGRHFDIFGEWDGESMLPLSLCSERLFYKLERRQGLIVA